MEVQTSPQIVAPAAGVMVADDSMVSGVNWASIFAGAAAAAALSYILVILGFGLGLSVISPWSAAGVGAGTFGIATILWLSFTQIVASGMGGYLGGRLRVKWASVHTDEVYFRDTAHGFLSWCVASLVVAAFLATAIGNVLSAGSTVAGKTVEAVGAATGAGVISAGEATSSSANYFADSLFRSQSAPPATNPQSSTQPPATEGSQTESQPESMNSAESSANRSSRESNVEAARILAMDISMGSLKDADRQYLGQVVARRTGLSQQEADQRVDSTFTEMKQSLDATKAKTKEAADQARKASSIAMLWMFVALLIGAFCASLAATWGGRQRDNPSFAPSRTRR